MRTKNEQIAPVGHEHCRTCHGARYRLLAHWYTVTANYAAPFMVPGIIPKASLGLCRISYNKNVVPDQASCLERVLRYWPNSHPNPRQAGWQWVAGNRHEQPGVAVCVQDRVDDGGHKHTLLTLLCFGSHS